MLGYILSKINLLILVTAIFAIVSFFAMGLTDITKVTESKELASRLTEKSFALTSSPSYCLSDSYLLPPELMVAGNEFYYVIAISKRTIELEEAGEEINLLIFSVYPRDEISKSYDVEADYVPKVIAADSFRTNAELHLYSKDYTGDNYTSSSAEKDIIYLDPQAITNGNYLMFIKEIVNGEPFLYVIGCGPDKAICEAEKTRIGEELVHLPEGASEEGFKC